MSLEENVLSLVQKGISGGLIAGSVVTAGNSQGEQFRAVAGLADPVSGREMTYDTIFDVASVTKVMGTATLLALASGRGLVDLDAPFVRYLPEFKGKFYGGIPSVRDFAMHIAGMGIPYPHYKDDLKRMIRELLLLDAVRPVRTGFEYSCADFILLGLMLENVFKRQLDEEARESFFSVLGLKNTDWGQSADVNRTVRTVNAPPGVISDFGAQEMHPHPAGNAGIFTTAEDIGIFARMMLRRGEGFFTPEAAKELFTNRMPPHIGRRHALGWDMWDEMIPAGMSGEAVFHSGWTGQTLWIDPGKDIYIAVLTNRMGEHAPAKALRKNIGGALADAFLK